jgi:hypothetical protein
MKSLSPNAQEFVPLNGAILNQALNQIAGSQPTMTVYLMNASDINNSAGANTQFNNYLHPQPSQFGYINNYAYPYNKQSNSPGVQSPIAGNQPQITTNNQYPIYINPEFVGTMSPSQPPTQQPPTLSLISHSPIALQMQPITPAQQVQYATQMLTRPPNPGMYQPVQQMSPQHLTVPYQAQNFSYQPPNAPMPIHPSQFVPDNQFAGYNNAYNSYQMSPQLQMQNAKPQKFSNKQKLNSGQAYTQNKNNMTNNANRKYLIQTNQQNKAKLMTHSAKQSSFEINNDDEKDWPSLTGGQPNGNKQKGGKNLGKQNSKEDEDDDYDDGESKTTQTEKEEVRKPFLDDPKKLRMVLNNVNFIKTTLEQHYNENNMNMRKNNNKLFSFREAVMAKPTPAAQPKQAEVKKSQENLNSKNMQEDTTSSKPRRKSKSGRSRSKKNRSADGKATRESSTDNNPQKDFDLNEQEFPDLGSTVDSSARHKHFSSFEDKSDAYSSGRFDS